MGQSRWWLALACAGVMAACGGCSSWTHKADERTETRRSDDERVSSLVKENLAREPVYKFNDVDVKTFEGVVQLSGFVNSEEQKQRAGEIAQQTIGVARVVNSIALKPESPTPTGRASGQEMNNPAPNNPNMAPQTQK